MGEAGAAAVNEIDVAGEIEAADLHFLHPAVVNFPGNAHAGDDGDADAHLDEALDAFNGGHFNGHIEGGAIAREEFDDAAAERRFDDVGDEILVAKFADFDFAALGERMLWGNDEGELVLENFNGLKLLFARDEGDGAEIEAVVEDFVGNIAGKQAMHADLDAGMGFAEIGQSGKQGVDGAFVDAEGEFAALEGFEIGKALFDFVAEVDEALGVFAEHGACIGETDGTGAANEKRLA